MADQVTAAQFAQEIKRKYPQYAKVPDEQLAHAMVEKYPAYGKQVTFTAAATPKAAAAPAHDTVSATPKFGVKDALEIAIARPRSPAARSAVYGAVDRALPFLPAAGATVGGLVAGPESGFTASVPMAAAGGATGEMLREHLNHAIFGEALPSAGEEATNAAEQGVLGGVFEGGARVAGGVLGKLLKPFAASAPTVKAAKAGTGVRMTPGEATGSSTLKRIEELLTHMPGATKPMEAFREAQVADVERMTSRQVEALSPNQMSDEQAGQVVQQSVKKAAGARTADINTKYDEVKKLLGVDPKTFMTPEEIDAAVAKKVQFYKDMKGGTPPVIGKLAEARRAAASPKSDLAEKLVNASPEEVVSMVQRKMSLAQLRQYNAMVPEPARRQVQANLLQRMLNESADPQSGVLNQRSLAVALKRLGPQKGQLIFGQQYAALEEGSALLNKLAPLSANQTGGLGKMHTMRLLIQAGEAAHTLLLAPILAVAGHPTAAAVAAVAPLGEVAAMRFISLALAHPQSSAAMLKILRGVAMTGARSVPYAADALINEPATYRDTLIQAPTQ